MGGRRRRSCESGSSVQQSGNVAGAMKNVNNFNAIAFGLIEDEPIFEIFDWPTAQAAQRGPLKTARKAHLWHLGQRFKGLVDGNEKAACQFRPSCLF
jgi:hypothetical protein